MKKETQSVTKILDETGKYLSKVAEYSTRVSGREKLSSSEILGVAVALISEVVAAEAEHRMSKE